jgi:hypothetical protein
MIEYLKKLIDEKDSSNSKIFVGLVFAAVTIITVALKIIFNQIPMDVLYFVGGMTASFFGLSSIERFRQDK